MDKLVGKYEQLNDALVSLERAEENRHPTAMSRFLNFLHDDIHCES